MSKKREPKGVFFEPKLIKSEAFLSLKTKYSAQALAIFYYKRQMVQTKDNGQRRWICSNNGEIVFPYKEAERYGWREGLFSKILDELNDKGFLDVEYVGGRCRYDSNRYRLSDRWRHYGTERFEKITRPKAPGWRKTKRRSVYSLTPEDLTESDAIH